MAASPDPFAPLDDDEADRLFSASNHPYHYNKWRRKKQVVFQMRDLDPLGAINGTPYRGTL